jgi:hypothetical protein
MEKTLSSITWATLALLLACGVVLVSFASPARAGEEVVPNDAGPDSERINSAIDRVTDGATATNPGVVKLRADVGRYTLDKPIILKSNLRIEGLGGRADVYRHDPPSSTHPQFDFFDGTGLQEGHGLRNVWLSDLNIDGKNDAQVDPDYRADFVDMAIHFAPKNMTGDRFQDGYAENINLINIDITRMLGVCSFFRHVKGFTVDNVRCVAPSKGGLIFSYGSREGTVSNSSATGTGDDAMAFNSAGGGKPGDDVDPAKYARVREIDVTNVGLNQAADVTQGAALNVRGAFDITVRGNSHIGRGAPAHSVLIRDSTDPEQRYFPEMIYVQYNRIFNNHTAVRIASDDARDIRVNHNTRIEYNADNPDGCGIRVMPGTPRAQLTLGDNDFVPSTSKNICD